MYTPVSDRHRRFFFVLRKGGNHSDVILGGNHSDGDSCSHRVAQISMGPALSTEPPPPEKPCDDTFLKILSDLKPSEIYMLSITCPDLYKSFNRAFLTPQFLEDYADDIKMLKWFVNRYGVVCTKTLLRAVAKKGNIETLKWAHFELKCPWNEYAFYGAVLSDNQEMVKYLLEERCPYDLYDATRLAFGVSVEMIRFMSTFGGLDVPNDYLRSRFAVEAAKNGKLDVLMEMKASYPVLFNNMLTHSDVCTAAALSGKVEVLDWVRNEGVPWNKWTLALGVRSGKAEVVEYLLENHCPRDEWSCYEAAYSGKIDLLKLLRKNEVPWNAFTIIGAKRGGYDFIAIWAIENGCQQVPWFMERSVTTELPAQLRNLNSHHASGKLHLLIGRLIIDYYKNFPYGLGYPYKGGDWIRIVDFEEPIKGSRVISYPTYTAKFSESQDDDIISRIPLRYEL